MECPKLALAIVTSGRLGLRVCTRDSARAALLDREYNRKYIRQTRPKNSLSAHERRARIDPREVSSDRTAPFAATSR